MKILVKRNGQIFGPYSDLVASGYLATGQLLPHDLASDSCAANPSWVPLTTLLQNSTARFAPKSVGRIIGEAIQDLRSFDLGIILPWQEVTSLRWCSDRKLIYLALIGLGPAAAFGITAGASTAYWAIAFYFSALWALFFYYLFKTPQVNTALCFLCFFFTGIISIAVLLVIQNIPPWSVLYHMANSSSFTLRSVGMFFGIGINEELCKAAIVFWIATRPGHILMPQTVVFYGMLSGLGFGIYEGVVYQQAVNREMEIDMAYCLNLARLTSLPFLHAIWTGISSYFIAFAALQPRRKYGLWVLAICIPAGLHTTYNLFGWNIIGLGSGLLSVILLMTYLSNCLQMKRHLVG